MQTVQTTAIRGVTADAVRLELRHDTDAYRWYEEASGGDAEVSGDTIEEAIANAGLAWPGIEIYNYGTCELCGSECDEEQCHSACGYYVVCDACMRLPSTPDYVRGYLDGTDMSRAAEAREWLDAEIGR